MGSMQNILHTTQTATGAVELDSASPSASKTATLLIHTTAVTGDWTIAMRIGVGPTNTDIISQVANITGTGVTIGAAQTDYNTAGQAIPKPNGCLFVENGAGSITCDVYWLSGD